jgi:hypothetical protein
MHAFIKTYFNPLNSELNPICHLLVLLGHLKFMGPCIVSIFQYISNKMQRYTVYLYLESALHVSGGSSTHHQERIQLYLQHLVFVTPLLHSAAIVEELDLGWACCGWRTPSSLSRQPLVGPGILKEALPILLCRGRPSSNSWPLIFSYLDQHHLRIAISVFQLFLLHPVWCWIFFQ